MVARITTVAFQGIEAIPVDVQVLMTPGKPVFNIVGLPDKAVAESRERVHAALHASGLALPAKRITVNLAPADLPKEGSHYDLPIALGLMVAMGAVASDAVADHVVLGELALDGRITPVAGVLPAAIGANALGRGLICPGACGRRRPGPARTCAVIGARQPDRARQPFPRHAGAVAPAAGDPLRRRRHPRHEGHQGPGERQAGARDRRRRRPQHADGRAARRRQIHARAPPPLDPAAALAARAPGDLDDRLDRRRADRRQAHRPAAVPRAAPFRLDGGDGRRRRAGAAGRGVARA